MNLRYWALVALFFILNPFAVASDGETVANALGAPSQVRFPRPSKSEDSQGGLKNVTGEVVDKSGSKLAQAVVHLKNKKTLEVKTRISDAEGGFQFRGLDPEADYSLHAEYQGASSSDRTVSMFDDRKEIHVTLEVDTAK